MLDEPKEEITDNGNEMLSLQYWQFLQMNGEAARELFERLAEELENTQE